MEIIKDLEYFKNEFLPKVTKNSSSIGMVFTSTNMPKKFHVGHHLHFEWASKLSDITFLHIVADRSHLDMNSNSASLIAKDKTVKIQKDRLLKKLFGGCGINHIIIINVKKDFYNKCGDGLNQMIERGVFNDIPPMFKNELASFILPAFWWRITYGNSCEKLKSITSLKDIVRSITINVLRAACAGERIYDKIYMPNVKDIVPSFYSPIYRDAEGLIPEYDEPSEIHGCRLEIKDILLNFKGSFILDLLYSLDKVKLPIGYKMRYNIFDIDLKKRIFKSLLFRRSVIRIEINKNGRKWEDYKFIGVDETKPHKLIFKKKHVVLKEL